VLWQSWLEANPLILVVPLEIAPSMAARCEIPLSPGKLIVPRKDRAGWIFIVQFFSIFSLNKELFPFNT